MQKVQIMRTLEMDNALERFKAKHALSILLILLQLLLMSCREREKWLSCTEKYGKRGSEQINFFYLEIKRSEDNKIHINYIDAYNSTKAATKETPIAIDFAANVYPTPSKSSLM